MTDPYVLSGMLFGAMLPYMFAALTMISVGKAAAEIIMEVRDQFHNRPDLVAQDGKTTLKDCIIMASNGEPIPAAHGCYARLEQVRGDLDASRQVREMIAPGAYAILAPLFVGFLVGPRCLVGMLAARWVRRHGGDHDVECWRRLGQRVKKYCEKDGTEGLVQGQERRRLARAPHEEARGTTPASSATPSATPSRTRRARPSTSSSS